MTLYSQACVKGLKIRSHKLLNANKSASQNKLSLKMK